VVRLMSGRVAGKVALITGAARGQGRADALRLAGKTGRRVVSGIVTEF
jgi:NAD(P)-dependent dehydrogenase (short-subunit alcohol dehydrogenase family)